MSCSTGSLSMRATGTENSTAMLVLVSGGPKDNSNLLPKESGMQTLVLALKSYARLAVAFEYYCTYSQNPNYPAQSPPPPATFIVVDPTQWFQNVLSMKHHFLSRDPTMPESPVATTLCTHASTTKQ